MNVKLLFQLVMREWPNLLLSALLGCLLGAGIDNLLMQEMVNAAWQHGWTQPGLYSISVSRAADDKYTGSVAFGVINVSITPSTPSRPTDGLIVYSNPPDVNDGVHYAQHGPALLNNRIATPGAVRPSATLAQLCDPNFHTASVRSVTESMKHRVCDEYGIVRVNCTGEKYEIDHLISLELGGSNDMTNLWPQPYTHPGAKEKDVVENWLHRQVCAGKMQLADAQHAISDDWYSIYLTVPAANGGGAK